MTTKRWDFRDEDLRRYSVEIEHAVLTGDRRIIVNGREVFHGGKFFDTGGGHVFDLEGHSAQLRIGSTGFAYNYTLVVDGLTIPPEGATIPRPARSPAPAAVAAPEPDRVAAEQPVVAALAHGPDPATLARVALVKRVENGGRWFYWIAGLSTLNFVFFVLGSDNGFALGTLIDYFIQGILEEARIPRWVGSRTSQSSHCSRSSAVARPPVRSGRSSSAASSTRSTVSCSSSSVGGSGSPCTHSRCSRSPTR
jgi:hypothetical protein